MSGERIEILKKFWIGVFHSVRIAGDIFSCGLQFYNTLGGGLRIWNGTTHVAKHFWKLPKKYYVQNNIHNSHVTYLTTRLYNSRPSRGVCNFSHRTTGVAYQIRVVFDAEQLGNIRFLNFSNLIFLADAGTKIWHPV